MGSDFGDVVSYLNICRTKRNISDYEVIGTISETEVEELIKSAEELFKTVKKWLEKHLPDYSS